MWRPVVFLLIICSAAAAEPVKIQATRQTPDEEPAQITLIEAKTAIRGTLAETTMSFTVGVTGKGMQEAAMEFRLPEGTLLTGAALGIKDFMRVASVAVPSVATMAYESIVRRRKDPCLVQLLPDDTVRVRLFPVTAEAPRRVRLEFVQTLTPSGGNLDWRLPVMAEIQGQMTLTVDAQGSPKNGAHTLTPTKSLGEFTVAVSNPPPDQLIAEPDGKEGFVFHCLVPVNAPAQPPPRRVLMVIDASAGQRSRFSGTQRKYLDKVLSSAESATLAVFSAGLHSTQTWPVKDGRCEPLDECLKQIRYDGASLPGLVDLSGIPADVVVMCSSFKTPAGGPLAPKLPRDVPVLIPEASSTATVGGLAINTRVQTPGEAMKLLAAHPAATVQSGKVTDLQVRGMAATGMYEVSGRLHSDDAVLTMESGGRIQIRRGTDARRGRMILSVVNAASALKHHCAGTPEAELLNHWRKAPSLSRTSSFVVMEEKSDYIRNGIDFPPDLGPAPEKPKPEPNPATDIANWRDGLVDAANRATGFESGGMPEAWHKSLFREKGGLWLARNEWWDPTTRPESKEPPESPPPSLPEDTVRAGLTAGSEQALKVVKQAKTLESQRIAKALEEAEHPPPDPFAAGGGFGAGGAAGTGAGRERPSVNESLPAEPFSGEGPPGISQPAFALAVGGAEQSQPPATLPTANPVLEAWQAKAASRRYSIEDVLSAAQALHRAGQKTEAVRVLTDLLYVEVIPPPNAVRLIVWQLQDWGLTKPAEDLFGMASRQWPNDPGLISERSTHDVKAPAGGADLRVLMECGVDGADLDLEVTGPEFEKACWSNPLPRFGGALSKDSCGVAPEEFLLPKATGDEYKITLNCYPYWNSRTSAPARITIITNWGRKDEVRRVFLIPACPQGRSLVTKIPVKSTGSQ